LSLIFKKTDDGRVIWPELFEIVYVRGERKEAFAKAMEEYWLMEKSRRKGGEGK